MVGQARMNLPIEVVQQRSYGPLLFILARFARIRRDACLHCQHVLSQIIRLYELAHDLPGLIPIHTASVYIARPFLVPAGTCAVSSSDTRGHPALRECAGDTLYEAVSLAVRTLREHDCTPG